MFEGSQIGIFLDAFSCDMSQIFSLFCFVFFFVLFCFFVLFFFFLSEPIVDRCRGFVPVAPVGTGKYTKDQYENLEVIL